MTRDLSPLTTELLHILEAHHIPYKHHASPHLLELLILPYHRQLIASYFIHIAHQKNWTYCLQHPIHPWLKNTLPTWTYQLISLSPENGFTLRLNTMVCAFGIPKQSATEVLSPSLIPVSIWRVLWHQRVKITALVTQILHKCLQWISPPGIWRVINFDYFIEKEPQIIAWLSHIQTLGWISEFKILSPYSSPWEWIQCRWIQVNNGSIIKVEINAPPTSFKSDLLNSLQKNKQNIVGARSKHELTPPLA